MQTIKPEFSYAKISYLFKNHKEVIVQWQGTLLSSILRKRETEFPTAIDFGSWLLFFEDLALEIDFFNSLWHKTVLWDLAVGRAQMLIQRLFKCIFYLMIQNKMSCVLSVH